MTNQGSQSVQHEEGRSGGTSKSLLYCPFCGHASPSDGDWLRAKREEESGSQLTLTCPVCESTIAVRPGERDHDLCDDPIPAD